MTQALTREGLDVRAYAPIPAGEISELGDELAPMVESYYTRWYGGIPKVRSLLFRIESLLPELARCDAALCVHLSFFPECVLAKRLRPQMPLIHYCPELWTRAEYGDSFLFRFYERFCTTPDLTIDANKQRAEARRAQLRLHKTPSVLPNTIPWNGLPPAASPGELCRLASLDEGSRPWLIYAGNLSWISQLDTLLSAVRSAKSAFTLVMFASSSPEQRSQIENRAVYHGVGGRIRVLPARPWREIMGLLGQADAALMYYPESAEPTTNVRYCAPTKVFDYLAVGLPVVSSANPTMVELLTEERLGICAADDSSQSLADAIDGVLAKGTLRSRDEIRQHFRDHLSFEQAARPVIAEIEALLGSAIGNG